LAEGIETFFKTPEVYEEMKPRCRELAETHYSWDSVVKRTEQEFLKVLD